MDAQTESTAPAKARPIGIATTYIVHEDDGKARTTTETFDASSSDASEVRVGLAVGVEPVKAQPGDDTYSGMHDQGPLPPPKEGGPIAFLIGCVGLAKQHNDAFLTKCIEEGKEKKIQRESNELESPNTVAKKSSAFPNKRPKQ
eukprot:CAMPEP_0197266598 /NCGR_PEP_ID=MMETSP1432-20130617/3100_1 /TAXON_ID=44447 /ORGANISM="Pseudo-nitzschia delicatissima, Strain UNC1205" /LENGTH=143 /DNA_ID=CAMNT_0042731485 /DNA_START=204 /DNA_END=635 /DNA_ORIENTATION=+